MVFIKYLEIVIEYTSSVTAIRWWKPFNFFIVILQGDQGHACMYVYMHCTSDAQRNYTLTNRSDASNGEQKRLGESPVPVPLVNISIIFDIRVAALCHNEFVKHH